MVVCCCGGTFGGHDIANSRILSSQTESNPVKPLPPGTQRGVGVMEYSRFGIGITPPFHHSNTPPGAGQGSWSAGLQAAFSEIVLGKAECNSALRGRRAAFPLFCPAPDFGFREDFRLCGGEKDV
jgi:hypothetical protein